MANADALIGQNVSHYRILERLGGGGMGVVYKAEDTRLRRFVALKFLSTETAHDPDSLERFRREAEAASALNHPNICTIHDIGEQDGHAFIVMEFLDGKSLKDCIAAGPLPLDQILDLGAQIADGLEAAHQLGIVHRDIKPANILVNHRGIAKILDFGLAKLSPKSAVDIAATRTAAPIETLLTRPGTMMGTVAYMSPEQVRGEPLDARTDIFSLGLVLYEMATGQQVFQGTTSGVITEAILNRAPSPLGRLVPYEGAELERIVTRALQKDPKLRYQTAAELRSDLQAYKSDLQAGRSTRRSLSAKLSTWSQKWVAAASEPARRRWKGFLGAAVVVAAVVAGGLYWRWYGVVPLTDMDTVVLADFTNTTGDPVFDGTLRQGLAAQLEQSPFLSLVSDKRNAETLSLMGKPKDARLTHQLAREVCQRVGSKATIEGSISGRGSPYELLLQGVDCRSGDVLAEVKEAADDREQVIPALGKAAATLREELGESLASVQKYDAPAQNVTTGSLEALQAYSLGVRAASVNADFKGAIPPLERAVSLDPNFAMAYVALAKNYWNIGEHAQAAESARRAYGLRQRVSERERFAIEAAYESNVTENREAARKVYEVWAQAYPRDDVPPNNLGGIYGMLGEHEKALAAYQESLRLDPGSAVVYGNLTFAYIKLNRLDEAKATIQEAQAHNLDSLHLNFGLYLISFLEQDTAGMERAAALLISKPGGAPFALSFESETAACRGQMSRARELARRAVDDAQRAGQNSRAASFLA